MYGRTSQSGALVETSLIPAKLIPVTNRHVGRDGLL